MSQEAQQNDITKKRVVYQLPGMEAVTIRRDVEYRAADAGALTMDIYYPPDFQSGARLPAVIFVSGYPDDAFKSTLEEGVNFAFLQKPFTLPQLAAKVKEELGR